MTSIVPCGATCSKSGLSDFGRQTFLLLVHKNVTSDCYSEYIGTKKSKQIRQKTYFLRSLWSVAWLSDVIFRDERGEAFVVGTEAQVTFSLCKKSLEVD